MARFKRPRDVPRRLKAFLYGPAKVGKTTAAVQCPNAALIDSERGTDHYKDLMAKSDAVVFQTTDLDEVIESVKELIADPGDRLSIVIDPITPIYSQALDDAAIQLVADAKRKGTSGDPLAFGRHYGVANNKMKRLVNLLMVLDMNVIVTAHQKDVYGDDMKTTGFTFDGWKKLDYVFDLILRLEKSGKGAKAKREAHVVGSRIKEFPTDEHFEWSFAELSARYGNDLTRTPKKIKLATAANLKEFNELLVQLTPEERVRLGIDKALKGVDDLSDLENDRIQKGIDLISKHLEKGATL